jgi:threonine synthase
LNFCSTRDERLQLPLSRALEEGIAPDGGLYVPARFPAQAARAMTGPAALDLLAPPLLAPFFEGDALAALLPAIATEAFDFPAPLRPVGGGAERLSVLELYHGPTAAFKDFGARFLAACLARIPRAEPQVLTMLVATSGDTGGAVAAAFHRRPGFHVVLLYPAGKVSPLQERQLTCWDGNVRSYAVRGSFDDCQRLVKEAFRDGQLREVLRMSSANSINIGRLLPQVTYFAAASLRIRDAEGTSACFVIPSGNLGQAVACVWARELGLPIGQIVLAHNANRTVPDFMADGRWRPRPSIATIATAMDVGDPSNIERLRFLYRDHASMTAHVRAVSIGDDAIRKSIRSEYKLSGLTLCPHSAAAARAYRMLSESERRDSHWVLVATAHPAKFAETVEPLIGREIALPPALVRLLGRPVVRAEIDADLDGLRRRLLAA